MEGRISTINRKTKETEVNLEFSLDGRGNSQIETGIGFFNHMLDSFVRHGLFDMKRIVKGDLYVDSHHTVEDTGIVLGQAIKNALGDKKEFGGMDHACFLWMRVWYAVQLICQQALPFV